MSRSALENEVSNLKSINAGQLLKIEEYEQEMYQLKRHLSTAKAMEKHLSLEIESVQINDKSDSNKLMKKISVLEDEIHSLKQKNADTIEYYESELQNKNFELENIKSKPASTTTEINKNEILTYTDEICDLKLKVEELTKHLLESETKDQETILKNNSLENQIIELSKQLNELKECFNAKKEELLESKEFTQNLQDENIIIRLQLDEFKSLPMEIATKGNSLFAEVNDNRVKLQKTMEAMKKKYLDIRTQYSIKCQELQKLHIEYAALIKIIENKNDLKDEKFELAQTYERHFTRLNENIKSLENELDVQKRIFTKLISKDWKCAQQMISVTREEVQALQRRLNTESFGLITSESNHYKTKCELKKWQSEAMQSRTQIAVLNQTINDLELMKSPPVETIKEESSLATKSCLKNTLPPMFTDIEWEGTDQFLEYSILAPMKQLNHASMVTVNIPDLSFEVNDAQPKKTNLMDELKPEKVPLPDEENNKENVTINNTIDCLSSAMRKVSFADSMEPQKTKKLGGRIIINDKPIHIPSIKRN